MPDAVTIASTGRLPPRLTSLLGRDELVAQVVALLGSWRLVTLTGLSGIGKTAAARQIADRMSTQDAVVCWVDLEQREKPDPDLLPRLVAEALGVRDHATRSGVDMLLRHMRDQPVLLVLDNCEHLLDAAAGLAARLLADPESRVRLLATSREPLDLVGEREVAVPPLPVPDPATPFSPDVAGQFPAVQLLLDRTDARQSTFRLTPGTWPTVIELCRLMDGMPLAIELAAGRLRAMSVEDLLTRARNDMFRVLRRREVGARGRDRSAVRSSEDPPDRHAAMETVMAGLFETCTPQEQGLWMRLSVFAGGQDGGWDLAAAEAVGAEESMAGSEVLDCLEWMVAKSIITVDTTRGATRFHLKPIQRDYGQRRAADTSPDNLARLRLAHTHYYRTLIVGIADTWHDHDEVKLLRVIRRELPNIRLALETCLAHGDLSPTGLDMAMNLARTRIWLFFGMMSEGRRWLHRFLEVNAQPSPTRIIALAWAAFLARCHGDRVAAVHSLADATATIDACAKAGMDVQRGIAAYDFAHGACRWLDCDARSVEILHGALEQHLRLGLVSDASMPRAMWAMAAASSEIDITYARHAAHTLLRDGEDHGLAWVRSWGLFAVGWLEALRLHDPHRGVEHLRQALAIQREIGDQWGPGWLGTILGVALTHLAGRSDTAQEREHHYQEAAWLQGAMSRIHDEIGLVTLSMIPVERLDSFALIQTRSALPKQEFRRLFDQGAEHGWDGLFQVALSGLPEPDEPAVARGIAGTGDARPEKSGEVAPVGETRLTDREWEVLALVAQGLDRTTIGARLDISKRTVDAYVRQIGLKLGRTSRTELRSWFAEHDQRRACAVGSPSREIWPST